MKRWLIYFLLLLQMIFACAVHAEAAVPPKPAAASGIYVQDYAGVISQSDRQKILSIGQDLDNKTTAQIAVLTVKTLDGQPIEDYALEVLRTWGIGSKAKNNGALILVVTEDRRSRIEVGYGLEGVLTDGRTGNIQDRYMLPYFRRGDYSKGILQGYAAAAAAVAQSEGVQLQGVKYSGGAQKSSAGGELPQWMNLLIAAAVIILLIIDNLFLGGIITRMLLFFFIRGGGRGGGGFGGGSGGGGGSSRRW